MHVRKKVVEGISLRDAIFALRSTVHKPHRAHFRPCVAQVWKLQQPNCATPDRNLRHPTIRLAMSVRAWTCDTRVLDSPPLQNQKKNPSTKKGAWRGPLHNKMDQRATPKKGSLAFFWWCQPLSHNEDGEKNYKKSERMKTNSAEKDGNETTTKKHDKRIEGRRTTAKKKERGRSRELPQRK